MSSKIQKLTLQVVFLVQLLLCQGCNIIGFLANPGPFEQKMPAQCELKTFASKKVLVWVEAMPGGGADAEDAKKLHQAVRRRLIDKAGISKKLILEDNPVVTAFYSKSQTPDAVGRQAGAGCVLYVRMEEFAIQNLHGDKIYSGQLKVRAFLIDCQNGQVLCPKETEGIVADLAMELGTQGRDYILGILTDSAAHCVVRRFYKCPKYEYQVNEERSTINEMIRQDVY